MRVLVVIRELACMVGILVLGLLCLPFILACVVWQARRYRPAVRRGGHYDHV